MDSAPRWQVDSIAGTRQWGEKGFVEKMMHREIRKIFVGATRQPVHFGRLVLTRRYRQREGQNLEGT